MSAPHPGCRIRSVTHKASGFRVVRLSTGPERTYAAVMREVRECARQMIEDGRDIAGIALVLWDADGASSAVLKAYPGSSLPSIAAPDFVRNRLLAEKIGEWAVG